MGLWGENLFEGDVDLDEASNISDDAGIELSHYELEPEDMPADEKLGGKGLEATREHLNNGTLDRLFQEYATKRTNWMASKELRFIFLGEYSFYPVFQKEPILNLGLSPSDVVFK